MQNHADNAAPGAGARKPPKRAGWLKVTLATSSLALTIAGMGLIAQREADQASVAALTPSAGASISVDLQPIPTVMAPGSLTGLTPLDQLPLGDEELQAPVADSLQQFGASPLVRSRSSR